MSKVVNVTLKVSVLHHLATNITTSEYNILSSHLKKMRGGKEGLVNVFLMRFMTNVPKNCPVAWNDEIHCTAL